MLKPLSTVGLVYIHSMSLLKQNDGSFPGLEERLTSLPGGPVVKNPPGSTEDARDWVQFLGWEDPLE